ncbi:MAG: High-affinity branched-chain amino acid transport system permease protein LivH, partial [uncultured Acetobacteraceae bacterium]
ERATPARPKPERAAIRRAAVLGGGWLDAGVRGDGLHQPRARRAVHAGRLSRRDLRRLGGRVLVGLAARAADDARHRPRPGVVGVPPPLRPRPPEPGAGDLRRDPSLEPGRAGDLGHSAVADAAAGGALGRHRADARPSVPGLPLGDPGRRRPPRRAAVVPGGTHADGRAGARRRLQRADGGGAGRGHPAAVHRGLRVRRHARGLRGRDGGADPFGRARHGRQPADPGFRRHRDRRDRQRARRLDVGAAGRADRNAGQVPHAGPDAPLPRPVGGAAGRGGARLHARLHRDGGDPGGEAAGSVPGARRV